MQEVLYFLLSFATFVLKVGAKVRGEIERLSGGELDEWLQ